MASQRRTKNFANDPQTTLFLYAILKQLDLRSVNWSDVADGLNISNGHAARMRYSRMKSQFEGLSNPPKPPRPKKENPSESKSVKSKAKNNKRLLMEEESERIASRLPTLSIAQQQEHDHKRMKVEPQTMMNPWNTGGLYTGYVMQPPPATYWSQPMIKTEPSTLAMHGLGRRSPSLLPAISAETATTTPISRGPITPDPKIKQEPTSSMDDSDMTDSEAVVKNEPGLAVSEPVIATAPTPSAYSNYSLSRTVNAYFDRQQSPMMAAGSHFPNGVAPGFSSHSNFSHDAYPSASTFSSCQNAFDPTTPDMNQAVTAVSSDDHDHPMMLNPFANTFQEMLNMPLCRSSPSQVQIPQSSTVSQASQPNVNIAKDLRAGPQQNIREMPSDTTARGAGTRSNDATNLISGTRNGPTEIALPNVESAVAEINTGRDGAVANIIEVESDAEMEEDVIAQAVADLARDTKIKQETVEL